MKKREANPKLMMRGLAVIIMIGVLTLCYGLPALIITEDSTVDMEQLNATRYPILGGGIGAGFFLILFSFFIKAKKSSK